MSGRRTRVAVVYGGRSGEHEVSVESARSVLQYLDPARYEALPVAIDHDGAWLIADPATLEAGCSDEQRVLPSADPTQRALISLHGGESSGVDVVFPLVHGTFGEDGCLQGLLELAQVPYVGSGVLASAVGMDKIVMKQVFRSHGLPVADFVPVLRAEWERDPDGTIDAVERAVGLPCFVKPANLGSSVGISKGRDRAQLREALALAAEFSSRIIVERAVDVRELECGVLGNDQPAASEVGEVLPSREFYDYQAKYHDPSTRFDIPASIDQATRQRIQELAVEAFRAVGAAGMARVDFFFTRSDGQVLLNEVNTIPGFTAMSVYPRLWAASGLSYSQLLEHLIDLALARHRDEARNRTRYE